jgi:hypothetical protein
MRIPALVLSLLSLLFAVQLSASAADLEVSVHFSSKEISVIHDFYRENDGGGKKRNKPLPPGIAKNLARGKPLPPGIAKRVLPNDLLIRLPPVADGYERIAIAGKILLVEIATQVVHDILVDVILD